MPRVPTVDEIAPADDGSGFAPIPDDEGMPDAMDLKDAPAWHETHCGHGKTYDEECPACEAIWIGDMIVWLRRKARKLGYRLVPIARP